MRYWSKVEPSMYQGAMAITLPMLPEADEISKNTLITVICGT